MAPRNRIELGTLFVVVVVECARSNYAAVVVSFVKYFCIVDIVSSNISASLTSTSERVLHTD